MLYSNDESDMDCMETDETGDAVDRIVCYLLDLQGKNKPKRKDDNDAEVIRILQAMPQDERKELLDEHHIFGKGRHLKKGWWTVLHLAIYKGRYKVVHFLLEKCDVDINVMYWDEIGSGNDKVLSPLCHALTVGDKHFEDSDILNNYCKIIQDLIDHGCLVSDKDSDDQTPLMAVKKSSALAIILLDAGSGVNDVDKYGNTALHLCTSAQVARTLMKHGANVNLRNNDGLPPIFIAALNLKPEHREENFDIDEDSDMDDLSDDDVSDAESCKHLQNGIQDLLTENNNVTVDKTTVSETSGMKEQEKEGNKFVYEDEKFQENGSKVAVNKNVEESGCPSNVCSSSANKEDNKSQVLIDAFLESDAVSVQDKISATELIASNILLEVAYSQVHSHEYSDGHECYFTKGGVQPVLEKVEEMIKKHGDERSFSTISKKKMLKHLDESYFDEEAGYEDELDDIFRSIMIRERILGEYSVPAINSACILMRYIFDFELFEEGQHYVFEYVYKGLLSHKKVYNKDMQFLLNSWTGCKHSGDRPQKEMLNAIHLAVEHIRLCILHEGYFDDIYAHMNDDIAYMMLFWMLKLCHEGMDDASKKTLVEDLTKLCKLLDEWSHFRGLQRPVTHTALVIFGIVTIAVIEPDQEQLHKVCTLGKNLLSLLFLGGFKADCVADDTGDSLLHVLATIPSIEVITNLLPFLLGHGAHMDAVNAKNKSAFDCLNRLEGIQLNKLDHVTLQCLAARVIVKKKVPFAGVAKHLESFINLHGKPEDDYGTCCVM